MNILILTVGSNPLPNYVTAAYLLDPRRDSNELKKAPSPDKIILVHSKLTRDYAMQIRTALKEKDLIESKEIVKLVNLNTNERQGEEVITTITDSLSSLKDDIKTLHLNYTGGTKPMSVYSYLAVSKFAIENNIGQCLFSDLDPEKHKISIDFAAVSDDTANPNNRVLNINTNMIFPSQGDIRNFVCLTIDDILKLHIMSKIDNKDLSDKVVDHIGFRNKYFEYFKGVEYEDIRKTFNDLHYKLESYREEHGINSNLPSKEVKSKQYKKLYKYFDNCLLNKNIDDNKELFSWFIEYGHGRWLEYYFVNVIGSIIDSDPNHKKLYNKSISIKANPARDSRQCEVDLVVIRGYQMFLISCTTANTLSIVKGKAFEAMYRAEQFGGDHSQVIVVSFLRGVKNKGLYSQTELLEKDLLSFDAKHNKRCEVIGIELLLNEDKLKDRLNKIIFK